MKFKEALKLTCGEIVEHKKMKNADGTPLCLYVTGKVKTWKRDKTRIKIPVKHGLYEYGYLVNGTIEGSAGSFNVDIKEVDKQC